MTIFAKIAARIIKEQELIIGPIAWSEAGKVKGLQIINPKTGEVAFGDSHQQEVVDRLVGQYERLFGRASHEVCRDAVRDLVAEIPANEVPASLK